MRISSQNNQFVFQFPVDFIPKYLYEKFQLWLENMRMPYDNALDYLNATIKEIVFPSVTYENVTQRLYGGKTVDMKSAKNVFDTYQHELDITFRSVDSNTNYFMMQEVLNEFYLNTRKPYIPYFCLSILDKDGDLIYTVQFKNILLKSQGENRFQYQKQDFGENTFSITFAYNYLDIIWELRRSPKEEGTSIFDLPLGQGYWIQRSVPEHNQITYHNEEWAKKTGDIGHLNVDSIPVKERRNPIIYPDERSTWKSSEL